MLSDPPSPAGIGIRAIGASRGHDRVKRLIGSWRACLALSLAHPRHRPDRIAPVQHDVGARKAGRRLNPRKKAAAWSWCSAASPI